MKTANRIFMAVFGLIGVGSLIGVLFFNAPWHAVTASCCVIMIAALVCDDEVKQQPCMDVVVVKPCYKNLKLKLSRRLLLFGCIMPFLKIATILFSHKKQRQQNFDLLLRKVMLRFSLTESLFVSFLHVLTEIRLPLRSIPSSATK